MNLVERILLEHFDSLRLADAGLGRDLQTVLVTPRFPTSRHVVALILASRDPRPRAVAKIPRRHLDDAGVLTEAEILRCLEDLAGGPLPGVPRLLGTVDADGRTMLVETAVDGVALDPTLVVRDIDGAVAAGCEFVSAFR
jgi:hypothetical protein